jgi:hypothetical protein
VQNTIKEQQMVQDQVFYVPIPDVKNTICTAMKICFYMKLFGSSLSDFVTARKMRTFLILENTIGLVLTAKVGHYTQFREERTRIIQRSLSVFWNVRETKCTRAVRLVVDTGLHSKDGRESKPLNTL